MRELSVENLDNAAELAVYTPTADHEFLLAQPLYFEITTLGQYNISHYRRDILDYTDLAVDLGVLDRKSASEFLAARHFIPGGAEFGIYPTSWLVPALSKIELVGRRFLQLYGDRLRTYGKYQVRAVGFLSERLGSFLLVRHLKEKYSNNIPAELFGYMTVMVDADETYSPGLTSPRPREAKQVQ